MPLEDCVLHQYLSRLDQALSGLRGWYTAQEESGSWQFESFSERVQS
jgi:hypothetical protein